jgi:purine-binding chemotaxis protein CheW
MSAEAAAVESRTGYHNDQAGPSTRQMLTFVLGDETYGVDILRVQEIRGWAPVTRMPHSAHHVLGVLNLRGSIVPIVDLRMRLNFENAAYNAVTVIIVMSIESATGRRDVGVVVDAVSDVVDVPMDQVKPSPEVGSHGSNAYIQGLATIADRMVMLLDIDHMVGADIMDPSAMVA